MAWRQRNVRTPAFFGLRSLSWLVLGLTLTIPAFGQILDKEIGSLAGRLSKTLVAKSKTKIAVADFTDLQGRPTELGRFLAEQLSVELVNAPGMAVMDRANLKSILAEHKLSEDGLINPETAKKLGQFAGVDAILIGTITSLDDDIVLTVKAISTETAEIAAASKATIPKTKEIQQFSVHGITANSSGRSSATRLETIATKDFGDLRVSLKSIQRATIDTRRGSEEGFRCVLEFTNLNLKNLLMFAANGELSDPSRPRSQLTDSSGNTLKASELRGISGASVYGHQGVVSPSAIAEALMYGQRTAGRAYLPGERLWIGDLTSLPAGESVQATVTFTAPQRQRNSGFSVPQVGSPQVGNDEVQFECELVIGTGSKAKSFKLHNLIWNNITISEGDHG